MTTDSRYNLKIVQTRPDTNIEWYAPEGKWESAWNEFNYYYVDFTTTELDENGQEKTVEHTNQRRKKFIIDPLIQVSNDGLANTRIYFNMDANTHNELVALLNNDESHLSDEKKYNEQHGIAYEIISEEIPVEPTTP